MTLLNLKKETLELETEASVLEEGEYGDSMKSALRSLKQEATEDRTTAYLENMSPASVSNQPEHTVQEPSLNVLLLHLNHKRLRPNIHSCLQRLKHHQLLLHRTSQDIC